MSEMLEPTPTGALTPGALTTDALIERLTAHLRPVRRLPPATLLVALWIAALLLGAALVSRGIDLRQVSARLMATPDMLLAAIGSTLTAITAAAATFLVGRPDRSPRLAYLPLPPLLLWIGANGIGCLRADLPGLRPASATQAATECLPFILATSIPLALILLLLLRRSASLRPERTMLMAGLAVAASAATLLWIDHPFDAGLTDLLVHMAAIAPVVLATRLAAYRLIR